MTPDMSGLISVFDQLGELISITGEKSLMSRLKGVFDCDTKAKSGRMDSDASAIDIHWKED